MIAALAVLRIKELEKRIDTLVAAQNEARDGFLARIAALLQLEDEVERLHNNWETAELKLEQANARIAALEAERDDRERMLQVALKEGWVSPDLARTLSQRIAELEAQLNRIY